MAAMQYPKVEAYDGYLYIVLHGIDFQARRPLLRRPTTSTSSSGRTTSSPCTTATRRSIDELRENMRHATRRCMAEGPVALFHRIVDAMVDHYRPEVEKLEERIDELENGDLRATRRRAGPADPRREARGRAACAAIVTPQRDVIAPPGAARLRRHQHRDVVPVPRHLRPPGAHRRRRDDLPGPHHRHARRAPDNVSNRLNEVMKVLTVVVDDLHAADAAVGICGA